MTAEETAPETDWQRRFEEERRAFSLFRKEAEERKKEARRKERIQRIFTEAGLPQARRTAILRLMALPEEEDPGEEAELVSALRESREEEARGRRAEVPRPPRGERTVTREEILAIRDARERQTAIARNHELFGF